MSLLSKISCLVLLLVFVVTPLNQASAQQSSIGLYLDPPDITDFPNVVVRLSAWDESGLPLTGLTAENFTLQEDGGSPFHPSMLEADARAPLQVILVIDISGSMNGKPLEDAKVAAARFLDKLTPGDEAALIAFSDLEDTNPRQINPEREHPFSSNLGPIYDRIEGLQAVNYTHLYNALTKAIRMSENLPGGHRAVLLLSDGVNEPANVGNPDEPIQLAQQAQIPVFVIGLGNKIDEQYLGRLASETGGLFRKTPRSSELAKLFTDMASLLKTQYRMTYQSKLPQTGDMHILTLTLNTAGKVETRQIEFGPLPEVPPTDTPTLTDTPPPPTYTPTVSPTHTATTSPTATPIPPTPTPTPLPPLPTLWEKPTTWVAGGLILALIVVGIILGLRRPRPQPEACAKCGYDMTGKSGACPQCGETRRLLKV
jgi:VWFA-related protein